MVKSLWIVAAVIGFAQPAVNTPRQGRDTQHNASRDAAEGDPATPPLAPAAGQSGPIAQAPYGKPEDKSAPQRPGYWREAFGPTNVPNWGLVIVGAVAGCLAWLTVRAIQAQAAAQMNADRAWIVVSVLGQPEEPLTKNLFDGVIPGIVWQMRVTGNTPARIIRENYRCRIVAATPDTPSKPMLESGPVYLPGDSIESMVVYPPGAQRLISCFLESPPGNMMDSVSLVCIGRAFFCAYGRIEYEDAFKRRGVTQFCAVYTPPIGGIIKSPDGVVLNPPGFRIAGPPGYNYNT